MNSLLLTELTESLIGDPYTDFLPNGFDVIECGYWVNCHKAESRSDIVHHSESGTFYCCSFYRTGDYWRGYETELSDVHEVEPYQHMVTSYRAKEKLNDE